MTRCAVAFSAAFAFVSFISMSSISCNASALEVEFAPLGFDSGGSVVLVATEKGVSTNVIQFDPRSAKWALLTRQPGAILGSQISADGRHVVAAMDLGRRGGSLIKLSFADGKVSTLFSSKNRLSQPRLSSDESKVTFVSHESKKTSMIRQFDSRSGEFNAMAPAGAMYASPFYAGESGDIVCVRLSDWTHYSPIASSTWQQLELIALRRGEAVILEKMRTRVDDPPMIFERNGQIALAVPAYSKYAVYHFNGGEYMGHSDVRFRPLGTDSFTFVPDSRTAFVVRWLVPDELKDGEGPRSNIQHAIWSRRTGDAEAKRLFDLDRAIEGLGFKNARICVSSGADKIALTVIARSAERSERPVLVLIDDEDGASKSYDIPTQLFVRLRD